MPPTNPKPDKPKYRGETWLLHDNRQVVFLGLRAVTKGEVKIRMYEVLNERGMLECLAEGEFRKKVQPPKE